MAPDKWQNSEKEISRQEAFTQKLLRWRLEKAKAEAPPAPSAASLLARAGAWWEPRQSGSN